MAKHDTDLPVFARRLKELRSEAKMTQKELAERTGMHLGGIFKLEQGVNRPSWDTVQLLAVALGVDCTAFVDPALKQPAKEPARPKGKPRGRPKKAEAAPPEPPPPRSARASERIDPMLTCQQCGCHISRAGAEGGARIVGDAQRTLCPTCAVELHYAAVDAALGTNEGSSDRGSERTGARSGA